MILYYPEKNTPYSEVQGKLQWENEAQEHWPATIKFSNTQRPDAFFDVKVDSLGQYRLKLPAGTYSVAVPTTRQENESYDIDVIKSSSPDSECQCS